MMKRIAIVSVFGAIALCALTFSQTTLAANGANESGKPAAAPADRVVVMYFHRTQRCPICKRMGSYTEEAVLKGFPKEVEDGSVEFHFVDFQKEENAALAQGYKVGGPTLIVAQVVANKVKAFKNLQEMWEKNNDKDAFLKYVRENVSAYQKKADSKTARR
ncbi:MAG: nitrophenyl compound nitroreductase subunit ArsF family protein [Planctomycetaceae bacterium]|nr:nitrophenyl compound nitroreductase subunit ArsF family protein [Planctomycetaceae bacterium]